MIFDGSNIQAATRKAVELGEWLDLDGQAWRHDFPIEVKGNLKMRNGSLRYGGSGRESFVRVDGTPTIVDVGFERIQSVGLIGLEVRGAVRGSLTRCKFKNWRNGDCTGLKLAGCQSLASFACEFEDNDRHLHIARERTLSTDVKFYSPWFVTSINTNNVSGILIEDARHTSFYGGTIDGSRKGHLIELRGSHYTLFDGTRFEGPGTAQPGLYSNVALRDRSRLVILRGATFDNTRPDSERGIRPVAICADSTVREIRLRDSFFPVTTSSINGGADYEQAGCINFSEES